MIDVKYRDAALKWNNGNRDFDEGIRILREARFRPAVVNRLAKDKNRPGSDERLRVNMRALISAFCVGGEQLTDDTDVELHVFDGKEDIPTQEPAAEVGILSHENDPGNLGLVAKRYADLYRQRDRAFKQLKQVGESNDESSCILRKQLAEQIETCTDGMEALYPFYHRWKETKVEPTDEELSSLEPSAEQNVAEPVSVLDLDSLSKDDLTKLQYNIAKRIARSRNKILYQNENKLDVENPLPEGSPKRIKLEKKISKLEVELEQVKLKIAQIS